MDPQKGQSAVSGVPQAANDGVSSSSDALEQNALAGGFGDQIPQPSMPIQPQMSASHAGSTDLQASDSKIIEKAWVLKAKALIAATSLDPFEQFERLNDLRAEYLLKRYGKQLKKADNNK